MIKSVILVGLGGGMGSFLRYFASVIVAKYTQSLFPYGIFLVNVAGCLMVGLVLGFLEKNHIADSHIRLLLISGFCGGFTTFSTFSSENIGLISSGNVLMAFMYISSTVIFSLLAVWPG